MLRWIGGLNVPSTDGTVGVTSRAALVVGREWDLIAGIVTLTLHVGARRLGGYAPSAQVSSNSNVSGNTYNLTVATGEFPTGTEADDWFVAGDRVRVWRFDDTTSGELDAVVVSATGNVVQVALYSAWTPGAYTWVLEYDAADEWSTSPTYDFLFTASTAFRVALPTAIPAYVFAP